jgi:hypothetical protein
MFDELSNGSYVIGTQKYGRKYLRHQILARFLFQKVGSGFFPSRFSSETSSPSTTTTTSPTNYTNGNFQQYNQHHSASNHIQRYRLYENFTT